MQPSDKCTGLASSDQTGSLHPKGPPSFVADGGPILWTANVGRGLAALVMPEKVYLLDGDDTTGIS